MKATFLLGVILFLVIFSSGAPIGAAPAMASPPAASEHALEVAKSAAREGRRLIIFFYSIDEPRVNDVATLMNDLYLQRRQYNLELIGIALNAGRSAQVQSFNAANGIDFPVMVDEDGKMAASLNMSDGVGFVLINEQGRQIGRRQAVHTPSHMNLKQQWQTYLSAQLDMFTVPDDQPVLGLKPAAPSFEAVTINGQKISVAELHRNKPLVLAIFSTRCPNCIKELDFLSGLYTNELKGRFEILGLSLMPKKPTADFMHDNGYAFPVIADPTWRFSALFPSFTGPVPTTFFINAQGAVEDVHIGFSDTLKDVYRMKLRKLAGMDNPPLLIKDGYSGVKRCAICHEQQHLQWSLTGHATAFASLQRKGETNNQDCVVCHVTGYGKKGGYTPERPSRHMENVQCEICHGPGYESCSAYTGTTNEKKSAAQWKSLCLDCHTKKESLNFVFPRRFVKIRHNAMPDLSELNRSERLALLNRSGKRINPFDNPASYIGADACKKCHAPQYQHWQSTAHAGLSPDNATQPDKRYRYVTGMGAEGGYPAPNRTGVQCEACHGPGERHVQKPEAKGHSYIVGLGAECQSCVVEQICRTCHSAQDDPNFNFDRAIDLIRHPKSAP